MIPAQRQPEVELSYHQRMVLAMLAAGLKHEAIARRVEKSKTALSGELARLYRRIGANNAPHAVAIAIQKGWITVNGGGKK